MSTALRTIVVPVLLLVSLPSLTSADPVAITGGEFVAHPYFGLPFNGEFSVELGDIRATGVWPDGAVQAASCEFCSPGTVVTPHAVFLYDTIPFVFGDPFATAVVERAGTSLGSFFLSGRIEFSGGSFRLPEIAIDPWPDQDIRVTYVQPFQLRGTVSGFDRLIDGPFVPDPVFTTSIIGRGNARIAFAVFPESRYWHLGTTYQFEPVPEPGTLLLLGTGTALLIRSRTRRHALRRGSRPSAPAA